MDDKNKKIDKVFDTGSGNSDLVHLNTKQATKFIDYIKDESVVLGNSRVERMTQPLENIAKINIGDDVFFPAARGVALDPTKRVQAATSKIQLIAQEVIAEVMVLDDELKDNIEGPAFLNHLLQMIGKKASNQLERISLYAKPVATLSEAVDLYGMFTGAVTRAEASGIVVDASDTALFSDRYIEKAKLTKLYKSFPTKFRAELNGFYVPNDIEIDYEDLFNTNVTTTAGAENRNRYAKVPFITSPLMSIERPVIVTGGVSDTMDAGTTAGATVIPVADTTGFVVGTGVRITNADSGKTEYGTVASVQAAVSITLEEPTKYDQDNGSAVDEVTFDGADILWTPKQNVIWGIYKDITIERERKAQLRGTIFVMTARMDFQVENTNALGLLTNLKVK